MTLNFPATPSDGDTYDNFYWDAVAGIWRRQLTVTELDNLFDVDAAAPNDNDIIVYDNATSKWVAEAQPEIPAPLPSVFLLMGA